MPKLEGVKQEIDVYFDKDTAKKHRFTGGAGDVDIAIYIRKGVEYPEKLEVNLKLQGE
jgi:hypothetical protein